jgi:hypothetical protein
MLLDSVSQNGMMEYVSIPWSAHSGEAGETDEKWTVNLVLWFLHILAGNDHEVDWDYGPLSSQKLCGQPTERTEDLNTEPSNDTVHLDDLSGESSASEEDPGKQDEEGREEGVIQAERKRKRKEETEEEEEEDDDPPHHSFAKRSFSVG